MPSKWSNSPIPEQIFAIILNSWLAMRYQFKQINPLTTGHMCHMKQNFEHFHIRYNICSLGWLGADMENKKFILCTRNNILFVNCVLCTYNNYSVWMQYKICYCVLACMRTEILSRAQRKISFFFHVLSEPP